MARLHLALLLLALLAAAAPPPAAAQLLAWLAGSPLPTGSTEPAALPALAPSAAAAPATAAQPPSPADQPAAMAPRRTANSSDPVLAQRIARANGTVLICISPQPGQAGCSADDPTEDVTGYQVDLFRHALDVASLGFKEGGYEWRCMDWQPMIDDLASPTGQCYMAPGVDVLADYIDQGIRFTWPTLSQGLKILTTGTMQTQGIWSMFGAFHWGVWLALFVTILGVGLLLGLFHRCSTIVSELTREDSRDAPKRPTQLPQRGDAVVLMPPSPVKAHQQEGVKRRHNMRRLLRHQLGLRRGQRLAFVGFMGDHVWQALAVATTMSEGGIDPPRSLPGRIVYASFLFLLLVMLSMFTANTAGIITSMRLTSAINGRGDLAGKAVGVWEGYAPMLQTTEIAAVQLPWENDSDLRNMVQMLQGGTIKALLMDAAAASHMVAFNGSCAIHMVGEPIQEWGTGFAFPVNTSDATLDAWNAALLSIQQNSNVMDTLKAKHLGTEGNQCDQRDSTSVFQLRFGQVAGLWIILAIAVGVACLLLVALYVGRHHLPQLALASLGEKGDTVRRGLSAMRRSFVKARTDRVDPPPSTRNAPASAATANSISLSGRGGHHSDGGGGGICLPRDPPLIDESA